MPTKYDQYEQPIYGDDFVPEDIFHEDGTLPDIPYSQDYDTFRDDASRDWDNVWDW